MIATGASSFMAQITSQSKQRTEIECVNSRYREEGASRAFRRRRETMSKGGRKYLGTPPLFSASPSTMAKDVNRGGKSNKYP
jgi:hypothetical protein